MTTYSLSLRQIMLPIRLGIDPMERLLVASFKGDPEFEGLEPQVFDDPVNGKGMRVLRYRKLGKVDVYWQHGVHVDRSTFTVGSGIGDFAETTIEPAHVVRSLAKSAGVDPLSVFKAGYTPVYICEIKEDGKWVSLRVKVIQLWDSTSDKIFIRIHKVINYQVICNYKPVLSESK